MESVPKEMLVLLYGLLPGFVAAWIFYGLTAHPKPAPFERVVQALIFTVIIQAIILPVRYILLFAGRFIRLGVWNEDVALASSVLLAILLGLIVARFTNTSCVHEWLRSWPLYDRIRLRKGFQWLPHWQWTNRTSYPSEWYSVFSREKRYVVLHLKGGRRLHGWPEEWPDQPDRGQFVIDFPQWLLDNGQVAPLHSVEKMLIPVDEVEMVEFLRHPQEVTATEEDMRRVQELLVKEHKKGESHGR